MNFVANEAPCVLCGRMVNMESPITMGVEQPDGSIAEERMTEAAARALMARLGVNSPPVMCDQHEAENA